MTTPCDCQSTDRPGEVYDKDLRAWAVCACVSLAAYLWHYGTKLARTFVLPKEPKR